MTNAITLDRLQADIRVCRHCVEAGFLDAAGPVFRGGLHHRCMIVGQAPGARGHLDGVPWAGASGRLLRGWLGGAGFAPETFLDDWYFTSITRCFPGPAAGSGDRVPSAAERAHCAPWLAREIALVQPTVIVTLGRLACSRLVPETRREPLTSVIGRVWIASFPHGEIPIVPLPHPSGVSRWLNDPNNRALVDRALALLESIRQS